MTKEVLISICGLQTNIEEQDTIEVVTPADYYKKDDKHYIFYDELLEGFEGSIRNTIKVDKDNVEITKKGITNVNMVFSNQQKSLTCYSTPLGDMMVGIQTKDIRINETSDQLKIFIDYVLEINYEPLTDCKITIDITSRKKNSFSTH